MTDRQMDTVYYIFFTLSALILVAALLSGCRDDAAAANEACKGHGGVRSSTDTNNTVICNDGLATNKKWD